MSLTENLDNVKVHLFTSFKQDILKNVGFVIILVFYNPGPVVFSYHCRTQKSPFFLPKKC